MYLRGELLDTATAVIQRDEHPHQTLDCVQRLTSMGTRGWRGRGRRGKKRREGQRQGGRVCEWICKYKRGVIYMRGIHINEHINEHELV